MQQRWVTIVWRLTDTDNLYGLWPFLDACRCSGIRPIVGAEVTDPHHRYRAVCLVENDTGYANLCRLLTRRHLDDPFNLKTTVPDLSQGLTVLTGSPALMAAWHSLGVRCGGGHAPSPFTSGASFARIRRRN